MKECCQCKQKTELCLSCTYNHIFCLSCLNSMESECNTSSEMNWVCSVCRSSSKKEHNWSVKYKIPETVLPAKELEPRACLLDEEVCNGIKQYYNEQRTIKRTIIKLSPNSAFTPIQKLLPKIQGKLPPISMFFELAEKATKRTKDNNSMCYRNIGWY